MFLAPLVLASAISAATPLTLPDPVRRMVVAAAQTGDAAQIAAVVKFAKETNPESVDEIDSIVAKVGAQRDAEREQALRHARTFENWHGSGEVGGSTATGNSDTTTIAVGLKLRKDGWRWQHKFDAIADIQRSDGENTQERLAANYQANLTLSERSYVLGRVGWERNAVAGLRSRFTETLGLGYRFFDQPHFRWDVEAGPALSQTRFFNYSENRFAGRVATNIRWDVSPGITFTEDASALLQSGSSSFLSTSALTSKLLGALSARLSYNVQHETNPPNGRKRTDTITRATLVYDF